MLQIPFVAHDEYWVTGRVSAGKTCAAYHQTFSFSGGRKLRGTCLTQVNLENGVGGDVLYSSVMISKFLLTVSFGQKNLTLWTPSTQEICPHPGPLCVFFMLCE